MSVVKTEFSGGILYVTIDNPPVNATSRAVRIGLLAAVEQGRDARAVLLSCAGRTFIAGGDMGEFDSPAQAPDLPDVVAAIEHSPAPWVALLHGTVLGGGLEIALGCAHRIATPDTRFGLPEVNIGLIPGAGGTQRLPRLVGFDLAVEMATTGRMVDAKTMLTAGGIDRIADDLQATATALIQNLPKRPSPISARPRPEASTKTIARTSVKFTRGAKAPMHNLEALIWSTKTDFTEGQPRERALHLKLRQSAESRALRHAFFSERAAARPAILKGATGRETTQIAIIGGGLMGAGIATAALLAGYKIHLLETSDEAARAGISRIHTLLDGAEKRGKISAGRRADLRLSSSADYADAASADLAIEAVFEDLDVKQQVFRRLAKQMRPDALLASNTSYLDPHDIFMGIKNPGRCLGLHFFSPAHIMKLVEVIALDETSPETLATGFTLVKRLKKSPVLSGVCDGFIGNRMLAAYRRAADYLLADGALPAEIDTAMRRFGMPMGPYELQDLTGLQIAYASRQRQAGSRPASERYIPFGDQLVEMGRTGQRAGKGWYRYYEGNRTPLEDPEVSALILAGADNRFQFSPDQIIERLLAAMINEGARILEEGIAASAGDIDVVQMLGYGFPRWRGGPMHYGDTLEHLPEMMRALAAQSPGSWQLAKKFKG
ncbi:MAG: 3-hydroxyacyl-CoA dehydrogenase NAD-binding domain-containing protein [Rhodobacteraceae bacterium]|nr:3-hydroxyacyl-CoA dehydrogenase NAD-binding domain-containing protein [Paracoccaceae bacterium]